ncbi:protein DOG1-like 4 [Senna tora]|uniref:Protein DOG1-like 4 n=1 Tax=Senna tora TaxID=362788 RepID=A0A834WX51_9FABA|nr:protein DOG1-like 4 [Senna tora]
MSSSSALPSSAVYLSQITQNDNFEGETFHKFFDCWLAEQNKHLDDLFAAESSSSSKQNSNNNNNNIEDQDLKPLIDRVISHYEHYYEAKSMWAKQDVLAILSPSWMSSLEEAFLWIGGWRPTMAFHLLYSKSGLQFEARLRELMEGFRVCDLGDLSASQLTQLDRLQRKTIREEREITEMMARQQESVADASMVELSHAVSEMMRRKEGGREREKEREMEERVEETLGMKKVGLEEILKKADDLRVKTLKGIVGVLTPKQGIHFLIAAAELHLRLHEWGKKKDARKETMTRKTSSTPMLYNIAFIGDSLEKK